MQAAQNQDSILMLTSLAALAYGASMATHEVLGHGIFCLAAGGLNVMLSAWGERCEPHPAEIEAAGPLLQLAAGVVCFLLLPRIPAGNVALRMFVWVLMVFDLMVPAGYIALSGAIGFGDAAVLIAALSPPWLWRAALLLGGAALYYAAMLAAAQSLRGIIGADRARALRWSLSSYLADGAVALIAALLNRTLPPYSAVLLAAASSLGGASGMLRVWDMHVGAAAAPAPALRAHPGWLLASGTGVGAFILFLGRGME